MPALKHGLDNAPLTAHLNAPGGLRLRTARCEPAHVQQYFPDLLQPLDYWTAKRGSRLMPSRDDLDPCDMRAFLPRVLLANVEPSPLRFRYRLSGTGVCRIHPADATGLAADELRPPAYGELIHSQYVEVCRSRTPAVHLNLVDGRSFFHCYAHLILPLSHDEVVVDMLMTIDSLAQDEAKMTELLAQILSGPPIELSPDQGPGANRVT